ncbi:hypothetical protein HOG21_04310 [bacterium]|nr:hypothetical protein [bacterium]
MYVEFQLDSSIQLSELNVNTLLKVCFEEFHNKAIFFLLLNTFILLNKLYFQSYIDNHLLLL